MYLISPAETTSPPCQKLYEHQQKGKFYQNNLLLMDITEDVYKWGTDRNVSELLI